MNVVSKYPFRPASQEFYGWRMVLAGSAILFVSSGIAFYGHGVFLDPLRALHGWSKGTLSTAITLYFFTNGLIGIIIGRQIDRHGPKPFLVAGSMIFGFGLWLLSRIDHVWQLYAVYFLLSIGFCCTSLVPVNTLITNWFIRRRGMAMSVTNTGLSVGGVLLVPFTSFLIVHRGLQTALPVLGIIYCIVIIPTAMLWVKQRPSDIGQYPDGESSPPARSSATPVHARSQDQMRVWTRYQAARTRAFWAIAFSFLLALSGQIAYLVHQVSFLSRYLGPQHAAFVVSVTAMASVAGRLFLGTFVDRCNKRYVTMICFLIQGLAVLTLATSHHVVVLYLCTFAFGLTMGNIIMLQSLIIGECFGLVSFATVSGAIGLFSMPGAAFGPMIAGLVFDATQSYAAAFTFFAMVSFLAIALIFFAKVPDRD